jgi:hypothetical protein
MSILVGIRSILIWRPVKKLPKVDENGMILPANLLRKMSGQGGIKVSFLRGNSVWKCFVEINSC